jgi:uridine kinase
MKCALLISGYMRSFDLNYEKLKKNLFNNNDIDIYIHITKDAEVKYNNKNNTFEYIHKLLNPKVMLVTGNFMINKENASINNILNQNYKFYLLNEERKKIEAAENIKYDIIIKSRPDINLQTLIDLTITPDKLYIPCDSKIDISKLRSEDDKYICDVFAYGDSTIMNTYFDFYNSLNKLIIEHGIINETLLYHYIINNNIQYHLVDISYIIILSSVNTIAITGDSGSGKTSTSVLLKKMFTNGFVLECDRYHKWERNDDRWKTYTHLNPEANYIAKMKKDVFDLKIGKNVYSVDYDHATGKFKDSNVICSEENIIVCGLHSLYIPDNIIDIKIYMDTDDNLRIPWKIKRDIQKRGYSIEKIIEQIDSRKEDFSTFISPQKDNADIIINFYTDKIFNISSFDTNENLPVFLKIGINIKYNITNIVNKIHVVKIEINGMFNFLVFDNNYDYTLIIQTIINNLS